MRTGRGNAVIGALRYTVFCLNFTCNYEVFYMAILKEECMLGSSQSLEKEMTGFGEN